MITLQNMIFANPQAYQVFPNMVNPYNTGTTELARYTGQLIITDNDGNTHSFTNTSAIDFTTISGLVTIDNVTDRGSVQLGRWRIPQSIIITNDITVTVTPIDEVSSDGATITPQYVVKYNTYSNGELSESIVVTPDNVTLQTNVEWITINDDQIVVSANTNTEARQGQVTIQVQYQEYSTTANYDIVQAGYDIGQGIMQSMVLWYDLKKQGATNESMATTPTLIDHSGNGHDATCYNFAWTGMSGVGGYDDNKHPAISLWPAMSFRGTFTVNSRYSVTITNCAESGITSDILYNLNYVDTECMFKVSGLQNGQKVYIGRTDSNNANIVETDGIYKIQGMLQDSGKYNVTIGCVDFTGDCNITIEQLPLYPNALVSDGVDDYCLVEGLPLLNKEDGYTVIAKRKHIQKSSVNSPLLSKATGTDTSGAFQFERNIINTSYFTGSFGQQTQITEFSQSDDVYQTSTSYNGSIVLNPGNGEDNNFMVIFSRDKVSSLACALYSLLLFNRDLTTEEIEWVKTNLIETEQ